MGPKSRDLKLPEIQLFHRIIAVDNFIFGGENLRLFARSKTATFYNAKLNTHYETHASLYKYIKEVATPKSESQKIFTQQPYMHVFVFVRVSERERERDYQDNCKEHSHQEQTIFTNKQVYIRRQKAGIKPLFKSGNQAPEEKKNVTS